MKTENRGAPRRLRAVVGAIASLALALGFATLGSSAASATGVVTHVTLPTSGMTQVAVSPDGSTVYVKGIFDGTLSKLDVATRTFTAQADITHWSIQDMQLSADGDTLYMTSQTAEALLVVDAATLTVTSVIPLGLGIGLVVNAAETTAYVASSDSPEVYVVDLVTEAVVGSIPVSSGPWFVALSPDEQHLWVSNAGVGQVRVYDTTTLAQVGAITVGASNYTLALSPDGSLAYVTMCGQGVKIIDASTFTLTGSITGLSSSCSFAVAFSPDGATAYVSGFDGSNPGPMDVVDTASGQVTETYAAVGTTIVNALKVAPDESFVVVGFSQSIAFIDFPTPPVLDPGPAPSGNQFEPYAGFTVTATGSAPITLALTAGTLPPGLTFDPVTGEISGTPTAQGTFNFTVTATGPGGTDVRGYTIFVDIPVGVAPTITAGPEPLGTVGVPYSSPVVATGDPVLTFTVAPSTLPPGLSIDAATGLIDGTPTEVGSWEFEVSVSSIYGNDSKIFTITVGNAPTITGGPASPASVGVAYSGSVTATGTPTLGFEVSGGTLPPGLVLDAATGAITGTPTQAGSWDIEFTVTSPYGTDTETYTLVVDPAAGTAPTITSGPTATGVVGVSYVSSVTAIGSPQLLFEVTHGWLPAGLALDPATGVITGTPTQAGTWTFVVTVSNDFGTATGEYRIVTSTAAPTPTPTPGPNGDHSSLAFTGSGPTVVPLFVGGGLVLAGAAAIGATLIARRRATL